MGNRSLPSARCRFPLPLLPLSGPATARKSTGLLGWPAGAGQSYQTRLLHSCPTNRACRSEELQHFARPTATRGEACRCRIARTGSLLSPLAVMASMGEARKPFDDRTSVVLVRAELSLRCHGWVQSPGFLSAVMRDLDGSPAPRGRTVPDRILLTPCPLFSVFIPRPFPVSSGPGDQPSIYTCLCPIPSPFLSHTRCIICTVDQHGQRRDPLLHPQHNQHHWSAHNLAH
jgi:hypothetical protein